MWQRSAVPVAAASKDDDLVAAASFAACVRLPAADFRDCQNCLSHGKTKVLSSRSSFWKFRQTSQQEHLNQSVSMKLFLLQL